MDTDLHGKRVLVTGGGSGIGAALARTFLAEGARVAVHARSAEAATRAVEDLGADAIPVHADLTDAAAIQSMARDAIEKLGGLDILINNAGIYEGGEVAEMEIEAWDRAFAVNARAPFILCQACIPTMVAQGQGGSIVFISSTGDKDASARYAAYNGSKHAVRGLMRCLAAEMAPHKIRVNCIAPGWVETPMADRARQRMLDRGMENLDAVAAEMETHSMLGIVVPPEGVADMALYLASERGRHITAQSISVCGGTTHWG